VSETEKDDPKDEADAPAEKPAKAEAAPAEPTAPAAKAEKAEAKAEKAEAKAEKAEDEDEGDAGSADEDDDAAAKAAESTDDDAAQKSDEENASAKRVADALGVGEESDAAAATDAAAEEAEAAPNRAARRRDEAKKRRKKAASAAAAKPEDEDELPRDRNKRAKDLLTKRREQAAGGPRPVALLPSEMVDDALARSANASLKWLRANGTVIQWAVLALAVAGGGYLFWQHRSEGASALASGELFTAVADERGRVMKEDKRQDEEKELDATKIFKTPEERADAALAAYQKVLDGNPGGGPAMLAKLGEAGVLLDKREWAKSLELFSAVASSSLAAADPDVKGRAIEGQGLANEGKGDLDNAIAMFKQLESIDAKGFKELGEYHQGRVYLKKNDKEKAKELFKKVHESLGQPSMDGKSFSYLERMNDDQLRQLDPNAVPPKPTFGGPKGNAMTPEEAKRYLERLQDAAKKKGDQH
jgi:Tetratricopeptide repeat